VNVPAGTSIGRFAGRSIRRVTGRSGALSRAEPWHRWAGWTAYGAFAAFVVVGAAIRLPGHAPLALVAAGAALLAGAAVFPPRHAPVLAWGAVAAGAVAVLAHGRSSSVGWFAVTVVGFWYALVASRRDAVVLWAGSLVVFAAEWIWVQTDPGWAAWIAGGTMALVGGLLTRHQLRLVEELRAAQAGLAERARTDERNRIARELHDVIAHSLTVSLLHVASARMAVRYDPAGAVRALEEAERLGRESLREVRTTVGLLRVDGPDGSAEGMAPPLPGVAELPGLVQGFRSVGADVAFRVRGDPGTLPATTGLTVYRIVQEALTNAAKHAPGAPVAVDLAVTGTVVEVSVDSAGPPGSGGGSGTGSMRERAEALGGRCSAGPGGRGWLVRAWLPVAADRTAEAAT
jgi:signal transduction histidine kinase